MSLGVWDPKLEIKTKLNALIVEIIALIKFHESGT